MRIEDYGFIYNVVEQTLKIGSAKVTVFTGNEGAETICQTDLEILQNYLA